MQTQVRRSRLGASNTAGASSRPRLGAGVPGGVVIAMLVAVGLLALDVAEGPGVQFVGLLATVPFLAAALTGPRATLGTGLACLAMGFGFGFAQQTSSGGSAGLTGPQLIRLAFIAAATAGATWAASARARRERRLLSLGTVAEVAHAVIMRPLPPEVGPLRCAMRYRSAAAEPRVAADLIELADTPFGVRWVVGDVAGSGVDAARRAGQVIDSFRERAFQSADLVDLASELDASSGRTAAHGNSAQAGEFATVVLGEVRRDGALEVVCCGHSAPLLLRADGSTPRLLEPGPVDPRVSLLERAPGYLSWRLEHGDRLVMLTDGVLDAHRGSAFFEAVPAIQRCLKGRDLDSGLDALMAELAAFTGDRMDDDAAVLALEFVGVANDAPAGGSA
jgi:serine phosphatase RsbU (regulator of sigma subunit)